MLDGLYLEILFQFQQQANNTAVQQNEGPPDSLISMHNSCVRQLQTFLVPDASNTSVLQDQRNIPGMFITVIELTVQPINKQET